MRTSILALTGISLAAALAFATPAAADPAPPTGTYLGGCDTGITTPAALDCDGYYSKNVLNTDEASIIQGAVANLGGTWDGDWAALVAAGYGDLTTLSGADMNQLAFPTTLYGEQIIGIHFGNIADDAGNVSVFLLYNFGTTGANYITLNDTQGFSNYAIFPGGGGVPEPATWAMMLLGVGMIGSSVRRRRQKQARPVVLA